MSKPVLKPKARRLLMRAVNAIVKRPKTFDMSDWMDHDETVKGTTPYCGTVACLAGHIALAAGMPAGPGYCEARELPTDVRRAVKRLPRYSEGQTVWCDDVARAVLDLSDADEAALFFTSGWPSSFRRQYERSRRTTRVNALKDRVAHWLRTGE